MRPVLSMPGSPYHKIALKMTQWLSVVSECKINCFTEEISESLHTVMLDDEDELISFDVQSLYTNVPVFEAINVCTDLPFSGKYEIPPVDLDTFKQLLEISSRNVLMLTCDGYYRQVDGLAMGSPPAPLLANGWLSKFDNAIRGEAKLYFRYMDDILRDIKKHHIKTKLEEINLLHSALKFTCEQEENGSILFLDMRICRHENILSSTWYTKSTERG